MHRHGYRGRKFGRERDQRNALMRGLAISLIEHGAIVTTLPKAKDLRPIVEKMITKARKGGLSNRRALIASLSVKTANRLVDVVAPSMQRDSGYLRIVKLGEYRTGDNAELARIEFVDEIKETAKQAVADNHTAATAESAKSDEQKEDK